MSYENALPKAVQDQIARADEIFKSLYEEDEGEQPTDPENKNEEPKDESTTPESKDGKESDPTPEPKPADDGWEHKFKVLKGKYDKEVPRLHRQLRDAQQTSKAMADRVNQLEIQVQNMKTEKPKEPDVPPLSQDEIDQFGPDLIDVIRRVAKQETGVVLDDKLRPVTESVKQVQQTVASDKEDRVLSAREQMLKDLTEAVPDWEQQNTNEEFLDWLDEKDPYAGKPRAELLAEAYANNDGERVINLFKGFQKENAVVTPTDEPSNETPDESPKKEDEGKPEQPLDELVAPGTPKTGSAGAQNESGKKVWTTTEIQEFYAYKNEFIKKNPERDLPEKVVQIEKDIFAAQNEGRIKQ